MIYVLIYWIMGVIANLAITYLVGRTEKHTWVTFLVFWVILPFIFPLTLLALKDNIANGIKKKKSGQSKKLNMESTNSEHKITEPANMKKAVDDDPFEKEWQEFIKDTVPNEDAKIIERKIVVDDYMVSKGYKKMVMYLEDSHNEMVNAFIEKNHHVISEIFKQWDYTFMYAPKEMEVIANYYDASIPNVEWNASKLLEMQGCRLDEPIGIAMAVIEDIEWGDDQDCWVATLKGVQLDAENERELTEQIRGYWGILNKKYQAEKEERSCIRYRMADDEKDPKRYIAAEMETQYYGGPDSQSVTGGLLFTDDGESAQAQRDEELRLQRERKIREAEERKCYKQSEKQKSASGGFFSGLARKMKEVANDVDTLANDFLIEEEQSETLTQEDEQLLREIQERIERLHHSGIRQLLIEQMVRMTVKPSVLQVTDDARLLLTDYNKEVNMLPIDKLVYIFFLRHPEGVALKDMADHKEELTGLYQRVLGIEKLSKTQSKSVDLLCDPLNNSINEKLSRIRQAFRAVAHDSVANCYIIQGERGEKRSITLSDEYIELGEWGK